MLSKAETSIESLSRVLEHSHDCVKLISPDGRLLWMNTNGQCVMEIDDFRSIEGKEWSSLWPDEARVRIDDALAEAQKGGVARLEAPCPTRQGTPKWWEASVTATKQASTIRSANCSALLKN